MPTTLENSPNIYTDLAPIDIIRRFVPEMTRLNETSIDRNGNIHFAKDETDNPTGAYKWRGSAVKLSKLFENGAEKVVTASAGNHGQGIAWVAGRLGGSADVFVPIGTPEAKIRGLERLGANIYLVGANFDEATGYAREHADRFHTSFVHPFDDLDIMAGQGTIADELYEQLQQNRIEQVDVVYFVPVGGGGLLGGFSQRMKQLSNGRAKIIGVQVAGSDSAALSYMHNLGYQKRYVYGAYTVGGQSRVENIGVTRESATAPNNDVDGTRVALVGGNCLPAILANVDGFIVVDPAMIGRYYAQNPSSALEPAGALAQVGANIYADLPGSSLQVLVSLYTGRNQDPARVANLVARFRG